MSMAHYFDRWFWDPFIAKREMPGTNGEENTQIYLFPNATSGVRVAYRHIMNDKAKIPIIICAEPSKLDRAHEQIHGHLLSQLLGHAEIYFLHQ